MPIGPFRGLARTLPAAVTITILTSCSAARETRGYDTQRSELRAAAPPQQDARVPNLQTNGHLDREKLVRAVLKRNPNVEAARQSWRAVLSEHDAAQAWEDPMLEYSFAPLTIGSDGPFGQTITLSQKVPWPGKRTLSGEVIVAEAEVAKEDYEMTRLRLALVASLLFDQYYATERSIELNDEHGKLLEDIRLAAEARYETGTGSQQEPIQAAIELAHVERRSIVLQSERSVIVAQMNGLMHRDPNAALPPPPQEPDIVDVITTDDSKLQEEALANRPELRAEQARIRRGETARDLAETEYYPDLGVMASYNSMWMETTHQWMLGFSLNIPLQVSSRDGAVESAEAQIASARASLLAKSDEVRVDVERARRRLVEAQHVVRLYRERLLPLTRAQISAAQAGYVTGSTSFQSLIDAERSLRDVELDFQQAHAAVGERRAELLRALGRIPGLTTRGDDQ